MHFFTFTHVHQICFAFNYYLGHFLLRFWYLHRFFSKTFFHVILAYLPPSQGLCSSVSKTSQICCTLLLRNLKGRLRETKKDSTLSLAHWASLLCGGDEGDGAGCHQVTSAKASFCPTGPMYFVFCRLYPSSPSHHTAVFALALTCHLSTLSLHCIAGAGLPIHITGEVS